MIPGGAQWGWRATHAGQSAWEGEPGGGERSGLIAPHYLQGSRSESSLTIGRDEWRAFVVSFVLLYVLFVSMPLTRAVLVDATQPTPEKPATPLVSPQPSAKPIASPSTPMTTTSLTLK